MQLNEPTKHSLLRILGNDLPPRHSPDQTEKNVEFILEHEPSFDNCKKVWILNRIIDEQKRIRIAERLKRDGHHVVTIDLDRHQYDTSCNGQTLEEKVRTIININDARNRAIEIGESLGSRWILPFDGNCIFSQQGWNKLIDDLAIIGNKRLFLRIQRPYLRNFRSGRMIRRNPRVFFVPMYRLQTNDEFIRLTDEPDTSNEQEPQVALRNDCSLRFDASISYGNDDKVEFLRRTGNRIRYEGHGYVPANRSMCAGYVFRLASGECRADSDINIRAQLRKQAMKNLAKFFDESRNT